MNDQSPLPYTEETPEFRTVFSGRYDRGSADCGAIDVMPPHPVENALVEVPPRPVRRK
jgi:hypothetical protein